MAHDATGMMGANNQELYRQAATIEELYEYDAKINGFIDKATGRIASMDRQIFVKKALMLSLAVSLGLLLIVIILNKIF